MHPPAFHPDHKLLDWPDCRLELRCSCGITVFYPTQILATRHGNRPFRHILQRAKCSRCGSRPVAAWLCAGERRERGRGGGEPDWAIELSLSSGLR